MTLPKPVQFLKDVFIPVPPIKGTTKLELQRIKSVTSNKAISDSGAKGVYEVDVEEVSSDSASSDDIELYTVGHIHRRLVSRQVQLIAIGGTIGVGLYVSLSATLAKCGPISLLLACIFWCIPVLCVTAAAAEMVCYLPVASPFLSLAERCVDECYGFMASWNFWVLQCSLIPWELVLFDTLVRYWTDDYNAAIVYSCLLAGFFLINVSAVRYYGEAEFYLAISKVLLSIGLMVFVFITMCGANPKHDAYGFRYWKTPFVAHIHTGSLGKFQGWLTGVINYCFLIAGPEYVSLTAGEVINPRKVLPSAYRQTAVRLTVFFVGCTISIGLCCAYNDPLLTQAIANGSPGVGSSAYAICFHNLGIKVLPHIVNVLLLFSSFSAAISYCYCGSRSLYGMALQGKAPKIFSHCNKDGVPIYAVLLSLCWGCLAYLELGGGTASQVLSWIINLVTASQLINFFVILTTFLHFRQAVAVQNVDREAFTFKAWWQPYLTYFAIALVTAVIGVQGYTVFIPGGWSVTSFCFSYLMIFIDIGLMIFWKIYKRTTYWKPEDRDITTGLDEILAHEKWCNEVYLKQKKPPSPLWKRPWEIITG